MFEIGKTYKVKVEISPGETGFGRATIVQKVGTQVYIQLRTSKSALGMLAKGARIWFVSDAPDVTFNGLWSSTIIGSQLVAGKTAFVCGAPKLEPLLQDGALPECRLTCR